MSTTGSKTRIAIAAILKNEDAFVEEWIAYHLLLGVDHFILYDHDPRAPLQKLLAPYLSYVTIVNWLDGGKDLPGRNPQTKAYEHAINQTDAEWIAFIDVDEFIVLRKHGKLEEFIAGFSEAEAIILNWHVFGHNGYFDNPNGLIIDSLTRRRSTPGRQGKCIVRRNAIIRVMGAHRCVVQNPALIFDANHKAYSDVKYPDKTVVANINHYYCRSFANWMARVERGQVAYSSGGWRPEDRWKHDEQACLRQFVLITKDFNELVDSGLAKYATNVADLLASFRDTVT